MTDTRAQGFATALQQLEKDRNVEQFVAGQFSDDVSLQRPETDQEVAGTAGATTFWTQYLAQFDEVESTFDRVFDADAVGILEWSSSGRLAGGAPVTYRGVSVLDFDDAGQVSRFTTYYDTQPFSTLAQR